MVRTRITDKLLDADVYDLKTFEIQQLVNLYDDTYAKVDKHQDKNNTLNNDFTEPALERQREDLLNELLYYQAFKEAFNKANDPMSGREFYSEIKNLNKNFFNQDLTIEPCIREKARPSNDAPDYDHIMNNSLNYYNQAPPPSSFPNVRPMDPSKFQKNYYYDDDIGRNYNDGIKNNSIGDNLYDNYNRNDSIEHLYNASRENLHTMPNDVKNPDGEMKDWNKILNDIPSMNNSMHKYPHSNLSLGRPESKYNRPSVNFIEGNHHNRNLDEINNSVRYNSPNTLKVNQPHEDRNNSRISGRAANNADNLHKSSVRFVDNDKSAYRSPAERRSAYRKSRLENTFTRSSRLSGSNIHNRYKKHENSGTEFVNTLYENINRVLDKGHDRPVVRGFSAVY